MLRILLVDADTDHLLSLRALLVQRGYEVCTATTGAAAWEVLGTQNVAVLITERRLPDTDGIELAARFKAQCAEVKAIILTAYPSPQSRERAESRELDAYLTKPFSPAELSAMLDSLLTSSPPTTLAETAKACPPP
ncbi:MAG TPA: response regulator [Armatimonadetes bacterium]|nr:response regulator [Armatimonadota bacterium]